MSRVLILVEGQTEETFVREILAPHLGLLDIYVRAPLATTSRVKYGPVFKGGLTSYPRFKNDIERLLKSDPGACLITTMVDFYGLPGDFPGRANLPPGDHVQRCAYVEEQIRLDIGSTRFIPYLSLHEFEALLYVDPETIASVFPGQRKILPALKQIRSEFASPEEINDHPETAPSKRLIRLLPEYKKPLHGSIVSTRIGLQRIRSECKHFDAWVKLLESQVDN